MMQLRPYSIEDYETLKEWWKAHGWEPVRQEILPVVNAVVYDETTGRMLAAGFCYLDSSRPVAVPEWLIANPENTPRESYKALDMVIKQITESVKKLGYLYIHTSSQQPSLIRLWERNGYTAVDRNMVNMVYTESEE